MAHTRGSTADAALLDNDLSLPDTAVAHGHDDPMPRDTNLTAVADLPDSNLAQSAWWPCLPYGVNGPQVDIAQIQRTTMMAAITELRERVRVLEDRLLLQHEENELRIQESFKLYFFLGCCRLA